MRADEVDAEGVVRLAGARAQHVLEVLHGQVGQTVRVGIINGAVGEGVVKETGKGLVVLSCVMEGGMGPVPAVDLLLALPRPKVMKRLWAQLAALGVGQVVITNAAKVERHYFDTQWLDPAYYEPLLVEGLMQAGDTRLPVVTIRRRLKVFIEDELDTLFPGGSRYVCHPEGAPALQALRGGPEGRLLLAIGPEGGWTDFELDLLTTHGFERVSMGSRILRSDTACVAAVSLANAMRGA